MKERVNQLFKDKLVLVMLVLGLLTIVAAAGAVRIRKGAQNMEESPYLEIKEPEGMIAGETEPPRTVAGSSNAQEAEPAGAGAGSHVTENTLGAAETEAAALEDPPADEAGAAAGDSLVLDFTESDRLLWPVQGNVILGARLFLPRPTPGSWRWASMRRSAIMCGWIWATATRPSAAS